MTEEMRANDATRFVVIDMRNGNGPEAFRTVAIEDTEGKAKARAEELAKAEPGSVFGVFQKLGTAQTAQVVQWKGAAR